MTFPQLPLGGEAGAKAWFLTWYLPWPEFESSPRRSVVAGAGGQSDDVEDVELEEDGDREKHGVDQEARNAQCPGQDESVGEETNYFGTFIQTFRLIKESKNFL